VHSGAGGRLDGQEDGEEEKGEEKLHEQISFISPFDQLWQ